MATERDLSDVIQSWATAPEISARSVLVTIIGDTLVPIRSSLWMSQMLRLSEVFGFSDRLVRTSMNRLVAEAWLTTERIGRQSKYHLTELALTESTRASDRIYGTDDVDWMGEWVLLFLPRTLKAAESSKLAEHLGWNGFVRIGADVLASPGTKAESARELMALVAPDLRPAIATATFTELAALVEDGFFIAESDADEMATAYDDFVAGYGPLVGKAAKSTSIEAFGLRTMVVHDLRRIRLRWPELPTQAQPADWPGAAAATIATKIYEATVSRSAPWLSEVFERAYPSVFPDRFTASNDGHDRRTRV